MDDERTPPRSARTPRSHAWLVLLGGLAGTAGACLLSWQGVEPFATWLYSYAWYPLLLAFEGAIALRHGRFLLLGRWRVLLSVLAWSVPVWMLWEVLNFRLENWHYVLVPERRGPLWAGVVVSFATVFPACFLPSALVRGRKAPGPSAPGPDRAAELPAGALRGIRLAGLAMLVLPLVWPRFFFPLVWGGFALLAEPDTLRVAPSRSLLADALRRRWGRIGALLVGGALAGFAWEALNALARAGWIYTVPWLEEVKLFEMPPLGFLGFPPLALSCFAIYQWLASRGWAAPFDLDPEAVGTPPPELGEGVARGRGGGGGGAWAARASAVALVLLTLLGMETWTIASRTPRLRDLPGLMPSDVEALRAWGVDSPFELTEVSPERLSRRIPETSPAEASGWVDAARLATLRGLGTRNARLLSSWEVRSPEDLARTDPEAVAACFRAFGEARVRPARVRVWWRAARGGAVVEEAPEIAPDCPG